MAVFVRTKRVSCPLDDKAKARLCSGDGSIPSSTATDHDAPCLSDLVHDFLESAAASDHDSSGDDDGVAGDHSSSSSIASAAAETLRHLLFLPARDDPIRARLLADASDAAQALSGLRHTGSAYRRAVMVRLRSAGYDAGVCTSRWESSGSGLTAGSYEYVDVVVPLAVDRRVRYVVDVDFAAEFEIARAEKSYALVLAALPRVAVAREEEMRRALRVVAEAVGRSFRSQGLSVPPWRKSRYVLAKWLGPHRRTVSPLPAVAGGGGGDEIQCRAVGFEAAAQVVGVRFAARIR